MVGRPRDFDEDEVLEQATALFWSKGYGPTSLNDLLDEMTISRQSLYNTFGGKEQLFHRALEHYVKTRVSPTLAAMEAEDADLGAIEAYFEALACGSTDPGTPRRGCLMVNTIVEHANQDCEAATTIKRFSGRIEKALLNALRGADKANQVKPHLQIRDAVKFLAMVVQGLMVVSKTGVSRKQQRATVQLALDAIRP